MGTYRMRFLWPDEIDADQAHYERLLAKWGSDEAIDDMEHAFGSLFWQMPERVPCVVALDTQTGQAARILVGIVVGAFFVQSEITGEQHDLPRRAQAVPAGAVG